MILSKKMLERTNSCLTSAVDHPVSRDAIHVKCTYSIFMDVLKGRIRYVLDIVLLNGCQLQQGKVG